MHISAATDDLSCPYDLDSSKEFRILHSTLHSHPVQNMSILTTREHAARLLQVVPWKNEDKDAKARAIVESLLKRIEKRDAEIVQLRQQVSLLANKQHNRHQLANKRLNRLHKMLN